REHAGAVAARGVHDDLPLVETAEPGEPVDEPGQLVVGHGEQHELGPLDDLLDLQQRDPGKQVGGPVAALPGHAAGTDDRVPGLAERMPEHGAEPPRADDADPEACGTLAHGISSRAGTAGSTPAYPARSAAASGSPPSRRLIHRSGPA